MGLCRDGLVQMTRAMSAFPVSDTKNMRRMRVNRRKHSPGTSENLANAKRLTDKLFSCHREQLILISWKKGQKIVTIILTDQRNYSLCLSLPTPLVSLHPSCMCVCVKYMGMHVSETFRYQFQVSFLISFHFIFWNRLLDLEIPVFARMSQRSTFFCLSYP